MGCHFLLQRIVGKTNSISSKIEGRPRTRWYLPNRNSPAWDVTPSIPQLLTTHRLSCKANNTLHLQWFQKLHLLETARTFPNHGRIMISLTHTVTKWPMQRGICYSQQTRSNTNKMSWPQAVQREASIFKSRTKIIINLTAVSKSQVKEKHKALSFAILLKQDKISVTYSALGHISGIIQVSEFSQSCHLKKNLYPHSKAKAAY